MKLRMTQRCLTTVEYDLWKLKVKSTIWFKEGSSGVDDPFLVWSFSYIFVLKS